MDFLVDIVIQVPADMTTDRRAALDTAEAARGQELREQGVLQRIWRVPGARRNVGIWSASDATELHEHLTSLPLYPWMSVHVTALARHPLEAT